MHGSPTFLDEHHLRIGDYEFFCAFPLHGAPSGYLLVEKPRQLVERYLSVISSMQPTRVMELGIRLGGSTAMLSELARPEKLVSIDIAPTLPTALTRYLDSSGRGETVRPYGGIDQSDRSRLSEIIRAEFEGNALDLVIDDASHFYEESVASFEAIFPHVRPGGLYIIEDWNWEHLQTDGIVAMLENPTAQAREHLDAALEQGKTGELERPPLTLMVISLLLARASSGDAIEEISIGQDWIVVRRGPGLLPLETFRIANQFADHFHLL